MRLTKEDAGALMDALEFALSQWPEQGPEEAS
jgi:hypothetical protein